MRCPTGAIIRPCRAASRSRSAKRPPAFAPALAGWRLHLGGRYDRLLVDRLRASAELHAWLVGAGPEGFAQLSPLFFAAHVGLDLRVGRQSRFTVGAYWYNSDTHRTVVETEGGRPVRKQVRSNDYYPSLDFVWAG